MGNNITNSDKGVCIDAINNMSSEITIAERNLINCFPSNTTVYSAAIRGVGFDSEASTIAILNNRDDAVAVADQGIHTKGLYGIDISNPYCQIAENKIYMEGAAIANEVVGINITNGQGPEVNCNLVRSPDADPITNMAAIQLSFTPESQIECNTTHRTDYGLRFLADCNYATITANTIKEHTYGLTVGSGISGGIIGDQDLINGQTSGNQYVGDGAGNFPFGYTLYSVNSDAGAYVFKHLSSGNDIPKTYGKAGTGTSFNPTADPATHIICSINCQNLNIAHDGDDEIVLDGITSLPPDTGQQNANQRAINNARREALLRIIENDTNILDSSYVIAQFYATARNSPAGKFVTIKNIINQMMEGNANSETIKQTAIALNNSISPNFIFEANTIDMNNLRLNHNGIINPAQLNSAEKQIAENIAYQCPYKGGTAVYDARTIVWSYNPGVIFDNSTLCNDGFYFKQANSNSLENELIEIPSITLFPNPSSEKAILYYNIKSTTSANYIIVDAYGKTLVNKPLNTTIFSDEITTTDLNGGAYYIKVFNETELIKTLKLIVIK